ncbi:T9SS type B sorting domain-containing protein [bacterium]|nr:T9SS type B sorting domain-containing protein [bacterium]
MPTGKTRSVLLKWILVFVLGSPALVAQTLLTPVNLVVPSPGLICPGQQYDLNFRIDNGQLLGFGTIEIRIFNTVNPGDPVNGTVVGTFVNPGASPIAGPTPIITEVVTIPLNAANTIHGFYLTANPVQVNPAPAISNDTTFRQVTPLPVASMVLDSASNSNVFRTDSTNVLQSAQFGVPVPGGVAPIPPLGFDPPVPKDSTVNLCQGDSILLWNPDSVSNVTLVSYDHEWFINGQPSGETKHFIWAKIPGYYSLVTTQGGACRDTATYIGLGDFASNAHTDGVAGIYIHFYDVDTTLTRTGFGNAAGKPTRFCAGDSVVLSARETSSHPLGGYTHVWTRNVNDTIATTASIVVKDAADYAVWITERIGTSFSCSVLSNTVTTEVDPIPPAAVAPVLPTYCFGESVLLEDPNPYDNNNIYQWFLNGNNLFGIYGDTNRIEIDAATFANFGILADSTAQVWISVIDTLGCDSVSAPISFSFVAYPEIGLSEPDSIGLCQGDSITVTAFVTNGVFANFEWRQTPGNALVSNNSNAEFKTPGTYYVTATGPNNCETTDTVYVSNLSVTANAGPNQTVNAGSVVQLNGSGGVDYYWYANSPVYFSNPFDPKTQTIPTADTTTYYLQATSANGCQDLDSMQVFVIYPVDSNARFLEVNNVITPNGDGINDFFDLSALTQGDDCEFIVLNRWGTQVYYKRVYTAQWNGVDEGGNELPDGTYYFLLKCPGDEYRFKSAVSIIRSKQ